MHGLIERCPEVVAKGRLLPGVVGRLEQSDSLAMKNQTTM